MIRIERTLGARFSKQGCAPRMGGEEKVGEGRLHVLTEGHLRAVGSLGENFWLGCVSGVASIAPIARGKEAGINLLIEAPLR